MDDKSRINCYFIKHSGNRQSYNEDNVENEMILRTDGIFMVTSKKMRLQKEIELLIKKEENQIA